MSNYQKLTNEELVGLVRDEDQELYRYLIDRYQAKLLRYAVYLTGDDDQAADVERHRGHQVGWAPLPRTLGRHDGPASMDGC